VSADGAVRADGAVSAEVSRARANVDPDAIAHNCRRLLGELERAELCVVVKANGYGHGAQACARAALDAGASWLAVATVEEARELREAGIDGRLLVMGALRGREELERALVQDADVVVWREAMVAEAAEAAARTQRPARVHVKLDTGMGRLGTRDPGEADRVVEAALTAPGVQLAGAMTHFATADIPADDGFFERQLGAFADWSQSVSKRQADVIVHAANSAAVLRDARSHFDMVRCGVAVYGLDPFGEDPRQRGLRPALELSSYVAEVKLCTAGESTGYGRRFRAERDTHLGVLPIGYGDGWRRGLSEAADVLIEGRRRPLVGTVSMDSVAVELGPEPSAPGLRGAEAVLIGERGRERITVEELAGRLHTINYEITCGLSPRVERCYCRRSPALS
jgi:alanine racemase